jgi:hypothetical protein
MRARAHDHRLHCETLDARFGSKFGSSFAHPERGVAGFLWSAQAKADAAYIRFVRNIVGKNFNYD